MQKELVLKSLKQKATNTNKYRIRSIFAIMHVAREEDCVIVRHGCRKKHDVRTDKLGTKILKILICI